MPSVVTIDLASVSDSVGKASSVNLVSTVPHGCEFVGESTVESPVDLVPSDVPSENGPCSLSCETIANG